MEAGSPTQKSPGRLRFVFRSEPLSTDHGLRITYGEIARELNEVSNLYHARLVGIDRTVDLSALCRTVRIS